MHNGRILMPVPHFSRDTCMILSSWSLPQKPRFVLGLCTSAKVRSNGLLPFLHLGSYSTFMQLVQYLCRLSTYVYLVYTCTIFQWIKICLWTQRPPYSQSNRLFSWNKKIYSHTIHPEKALNRVILVRFSEKFPHQSAVHPSAKVTWCSPGS